MCAVTELWWDVSSEVVPGKVKYTQCIEAAYQNWKGSSDIY